jgi:hypothetical protein
MDVGGGRSAYFNNVFLSEKSSSGQEQKNLFFQDFYGSSATVLLRKITGKKSNQGCQMVCFQTKNPNSGKFWNVLQWKMLVYFMETWSILRSFAIFYGHLV